MNIIPIIIIFISFLSIIYIFVKKIPLISTLDVDAIPREREAQIKKSLMDKRFLRFWRSKFLKISSYWSKITKGSHNAFQNIIEKLDKLEKKYEKEDIQKMKEKIQAAETKEESRIHKEKVENKLDSLLQEAEEKYKVGDYKASEQIFLNIISIDPKNKTAYKGLADLYIDIKEYKLAKDTLLFLINLDAKDDEVYFKLADIFFSDKDYKQAWKYLSKALDNNPNNPKYLDLAINLNILLNNGKIAKLCLNRLREVNPNNQKIEQYQERIINTPS